jgi:Ras family protein T1
MAAPLHVSATWSSISELFVHVSIPLLNLYSFVQLTDLQLAESATYPSTAFPKQDDEPVDRTNLYVALGVVLGATAAFMIIWKKSTSL